MIGIAGIPEIHPDADDRLSFDVGAADFPAAPRHQSERRQEDHHNDTSVNDSPVLVQICLRVLVAYALISSG
ncbi:MAG: hypothetical protein K6G15_04845 [Desulfovibrio sp.]|nr:hypothetical protein [Desulfovibrio sp.]